VTGDIDICGGEPVLGLGRAGSDRLLRVLPEENILRAISIFQSAWKSENRTRSRSRERFGVEDFYVLHEGSFTGMWIGDVLGEVEDWFEAKARRKGRHVQRFQELGGE